MIGGCHQTHSDRCPQNQRIKIGVVFAVGKTGETGQDNKECRGKRQQCTEVDGKRIVHEHARKNFTSRNLSPIG